MHANIIAHVALIGWLPVVILLFMNLPVRRAVIVSFLGAWMFLPVFGYDLPYFPDYTKMSATCIAVVLAMLLVDKDRALWQYRFHWLDLPMLLWCVSPAFSSLVNGDGVYDAVAQTLNQLISWGLPYFIARVYFTTPAAMRDLAVGMFVAGLVYVPFCLWEMRFSPQLHVDIYGFRQLHDFRQNVRGEGYRPLVFMNHGLMLSMFMGSAALVGLWLWMSGSLKRMWGVPVWLLVPGLGAITLLCRSTGASALMVFGATLLLASKFLRTTWLAVLVIAMIPLYLGLRVTGAWNGQEAVALAQQVFGEDRASSLQYRFDAEELLVRRALEQPLFGWGGYNRAKQVRDVERRDDQTKFTSSATTDSLWIIAFGQRGLVGLAALTATLLLPPLLIYRRCRPGALATPMGGPIVVLALLCLLYMLDNLVNAMVNPIFLLCVGGCTSQLVAAQRARTAPVRTAAASRYEAPGLSGQPR